MATESVQVSVVFDSRGEMALRRGGEALSSLTTRIKEMQAAGQGVGRILRMVENDINRFNAVVNARASRNLAVFTDQFERLHGFALRLGRLSFYKITAEFALLGYSLSKMGAEFLKVNEQFASLEITLRSSLGSVAIARRLRDEIANITIKSPLQFTQIADAVRSAAVMPALSSRISRETQAGNVGSSSLMGKYVGLIEQLTTFRPDKLAEDATFAIREALASELRSLIRRFEFPASLLVSASGKPISQLQMNPIEMFDALKKAMSNIISPEAVREIARQPSKLKQNIMEQTMQIPFLRVGRYGEDQGKQSFYDMFTKYFQDVLDESGKFIQGHFDKYAKSMSEALKKIFESAVSVSGKAFDSITGAFGFGKKDMPGATRLERVYAVVNRVLVLVGDNMPKAFQTLENVVKTLWPTIEGISNIFLKLAKVFGSFLGGLGSVSPTMAGVGALAGGYALFQAPSLLRAAGGFMKTRYVNSMNESRMELTNALIGRVGGLGGASGGASVGSGSGSLLGASAFSIPGYNPSGPARPTLNRAALNAWQNNIVALSGMPGVVTLPGGNLQIPTRRGGTAILNINSGHLTGTTATGAAMTSFNSAFSKRIAAQLGGFTPIMTVGGPASAMVGNFAPSTLAYSTAYGGYGNVRSGTRLSTIAGLAQNKSLSFAQQLAFLEASGMRSVSSAAGVTFGQIGSAIGGSRIAGMFGGSAAAGATAGAALGMGIGAITSSVVAPIAVAFAGTYAFTKIMDMASDYFTRKAEARKQNQLQGGWLLGPVDRAARLGSIVGGVEGLASAGFSNSQLVGGDIMGKYLTTTIESSKRTSADLAIVEKAINSQKFDGVKLSNGIQVTGTNAESLANSLSRMAENYTSRFIDEFAPQMMASLSSTAKGREALKTFNLPSRMPTSDTDARRIRDLRTELGTMWNYDSETGAGSLNVGELIARSKALSELFAIAKRNQTPDNLTQIISKNEDEIRAMEEGVNPFKRINETLRTNILGIAEQVGALDDLNAFFSENTTESSRGYGSATDLLRRVESERAKNSGVFSLMDDKMFNDFKTALAVEGGASGKQSQVFKMLSSFFQGNISQLLESRIGATSNTLFGSTIGQIGNIGRNEFSSNVANSQLGLTMLANQLPKEMRQPIRQAVDVFYGTLDSIAETLPSELPEEERSKAATRFYASFDTAFGEFISNVEATLASQGLGSDALNKITTAIRAKLSRLIASGMEAEIAYMDNAMRAIRVNKAASFSAGEGIGASEYAAEFFRKYGVTASGQSVAAYSRIGSMGPQELSKLPYGGYELARLSDSRNALLGEQAALNSVGQSDLTKYADAQTRLAAIELELRRLNATQIPIAEQADRLSRLSAYGNALSGMSNDVGDSPYAARAIKMRLDALSASGIATSNAAYLGNFATLDSRFASNRLAAATARENVYGSRAQSFYADSFDMTRSETERQAVLDMAESFDKLAASARSVREELTGRGGLFGSMRDGIAIVADEWKVSSNNMTEIGKQMMTSMGSGLGNAFSNLALGINTASEAFRNFGIEFSQTMVRMTMNKIAENLLGTIFSGVFGGGVPKVGSAGFIGPVFSQTGRASGGIIPGSPSNVDNIIMPMASGEYVIPASAVSRYGKSHFDAYKYGGVPALPVKSPSSGGYAYAPVSVNVTVNNSQGGAEISSSVAADQGEKLAKAIRAVTEQVLAEQMRQGGRLKARR